MINSSVSVVIPNYNNGHTIARTLASVFAQTIRVSEVLVIDNHSSDNTSDVIASFSKLHDNLRLIPYKNHGVIANSRNHGASIATSDYVAFLDADDIYSPNHLELSLSTIKKNCAQVVYSNFYHVYLSRGNSRVRPYSAFSINQKHALKDLILRGNPICTSSVLISKDIFSTLRFPDSKFFYAWEDYAFWLKLAEHGIIFAHQKVPSLYYNYTIDNISKRYSVVSVVNMNISSYIADNFKSYMFNGSIKPAWLSYKIFITNFGHSTLFQNACSFFSSLISSAIYLSPSYFFKLISFPVRNFFSQS